MQCPGVLNWNEIHSSCSVSFCFILQSIQQSNLEALVLWDPEVSRLPQSVIFCQGCYWVRQMCSSFPTANRNVYFTYGILIAELSCFPKLCEDKEKERMRRRKANSNHRFGAVRGEWVSDVGGKGVGKRSDIYWTYCSGSLWFSCAYWWCLWSNPHVKEEKLT